MIVGRLSNRWIGDGTRTCGISPGWIIDGRLTMTGGWPDWIVDGCDGRKMNCCCWGADEVCDLFKSYYLYRLMSEIKEYFWLEFDSTWHQELEWLNVKIWDQFKSTRNLICRPTAFDNRVIAIIRSSEVTNVVDFSREIHNQRWQIKKCLTIRS